MDGKELEDTCLARKEAQRRACDLEADRGRVKKAAQILDDKCYVASAMANQVPDDGRCIYVGGLPKHAEWQELKDHMKTAGEIEYCDVLYNDWGQPRGIGFVRYKTEAEAQQAIASLDGSSMEGKAVQVSAWTGRPPNPNSPGKMMYQMMAWYGGAQKRLKVDPEKATLVDRVKNFQKTGQDKKELWYAFCGEVKDPARHDIDKLKEFVALHSVP
ncbi:PABN3 [Symbiodinium necroappetens]|uniref:PABN3 protein n=2 Tax=Symbiodinium TaxID=2949 RepID=A0A812T920_9DINO|nr:PABN3 [Symbiodinium necroappetens]